MNRSCVASGTAEAEPNIVGRVVYFSWFLLMMLAGAGWFYSSLAFARSVLIGGVLVNGSLWLMKTDTKRLMQRVGDNEGRGSSTFNFERTRFFFRCYARLVVLGLLLFVSATQMKIDLIGLMLGLATVTFSVVIIGLSKRNCWMPSKA